MIDGISRERYFDFLERHEETFRKLEKLLKGNPNLKQWRKVMGHLESEWDQRDPDYLEVVLPHVAKKTERWHARFGGGNQHRVSGDHLLRAFIAGEDAPFLVFCDQLTFTEPLWTSWARIAECQALSHVKELTFRGVPLVEPEPVAAVLTRARFVAVHSLTFKSCSCDAASWEAILASDLLLELHALTCDGVYLSPEQLSMLLDVLPETSITSLALRGVGMQAGTLDRIVDEAKTTFANFTSLSLSNNDVGERANQRLMDSSLVELLPQTHGGRLGPLTRAADPYSYHRDADEPLWDDYNDTWE